MENAKKDGRRLEDLLLLCKPEVESLRNMIQDNPAAVMVLLYLVEKSSSHRVSIPLHELEEVIGKSRPTISRAVQFLEKKSLIKTVSVGHHHEYILTPNVYVQKTINCNKDGDVLAMSLTIQK